LGMAGIYRGEPRVASAKRAGYPVLHFRGALAVEEAWHLWPAV
jgi:hypothetical protein